MTSAQKFLKLRSEKKEELSDFQKFFESEASFKLEFITFMDLRLRLVDTYKSMVQLIREAERLH